MASPDDGIKEYQEGNKIAMTYGQLTLMAGSIFISISFTIFGLSFTITNPTLPALVLLGFASIMLYWIYLMFNERYGKIMHNVIFPMLQKYEKEHMTMKFHTEITRHDDDSKEKCKKNYTVQRIRFWNQTGFVALLLLWIVRIIFMTYMV